MIGSGRKGGGSFPPGTVGNGGIGGLLLGLNATNGLLAP